MEYSHLSGDQLQRAQCRLLDEQNRLLQQILKALSDGTGLRLSGPTSGPSTDVSQRTVSTREPTT